MEREASALLANLTDVPQGSADRATAALAASLIAVFEQHHINPDPDVWQLISDKELERQLGSATFGVLNRRRESMVTWMSRLLVENLVKAR